MLVAGARTPEQARANAAADPLAPLAPDVMSAVRDIYDAMIKTHVHHRW